MRNADIDVTNFKKDHYQFCLPNINSSKSDLNIYDFLYFAPMLKTNEEISSVIPLEKSTLTSPPLPLGQHFYLREWVLKPQEMRGVISDMSHSDNAHAEVDEWNKTVNLFSPLKDAVFNLEGPSATNNNDFSSMPKTFVTGDASRFDREQLAGVKPQTYTIRYLGTVFGPRRPIDRFEEDLKERKSGIMPDFLQVLERRYPLVFDAGAAYLIKHASIIADPTDANNFGPHPAIYASNKADRERFLIKYFGHNTMLNRMSGGWFTDYVPSYDDDETYKALNINVYTNLLNNSGTLNVDSFTNLNAHWGEVQQFAESNSGTTGTCRNPFSTKVRNAAFHQSHPYLYRSKVVLFLLVGKDVTLTDYLAGNKFFDCESQAATLTRNFLYRLMSHEGDGIAFDERAFPFVDLWPWLWHEDFEAAIYYLGLYFQLVRPLIAMTFSRDVNEVTRGNFNHVVDFRERSFNGSIGIPTIQYYAKDQSDSAFINVPHIHPGRDKYTGQNRPLRRLYDLTYQVSLLLGQISTEVVDKYLDRGLELPTRKALCEEIIGKFEALKANSPPHQNFFANLDQARKDHEQNVRGHNTSLPTEDVRPVLNAQARHKLASFGRAEGEPHSAVRDRQLELLWQRDVPELHTTVKRVPQNKESWKSQFVGLPPGQYFLLKTFSQMKPTEFMNQILCHVRPDLAKDKSWMVASDIRTKAVLKCGLWFHRPAKDGPESDDLKRIVVHFPDQFSTAYDMEGRPIGVHTNGRIILRWQKDPSTKLLVRFKFRLAAPSGGSNPIRYIQFTAEGIDITDGDGDSLRKEKREGVTLPASVPRDQFLASEGGQDLADLWAAVRTAHGHSVPMATLAIESAKDWSHIKEGVEMLGAYAKKEVPQQNRPPKEGDALYILDQFLKQEIPDEGDFRTADPQRLPESPGHLQAFFAYVQQPEWCNHPYAAAWLKHNVEASNTTTAVIKNALRILRSINPVTETRRALGKVLKETYFELGAPGTADPDTFATKMERGTSKRAQEKAKAETSSSKPSTSKSGSKLSRGDSDDEDLVPAKSSKAAKTSETSTTSKKLTTKKRGREDPDEEEDAAPSKRPTRQKTTIKKDYEGRKGRQAEYDADMMDEDME